MVKNGWVAITASAMVVAASYPAAAQGRFNGATEGPSYYTEPRSTGMQTEPRAVEPRDTASQRWVRVGFDYNDDGIIDHYEYINARDLEQARDRSMERQRAAAEGGPAKDFRGYSSGQPAAELQSVTGTVADVREIGIADMDQPHLIGKITTPEGRTARVDFGPVGSLGGVTLRQGDRVTVYGTTGTLNDNAMLMAHRIEAGNRVVTVGWPNDRRLGRYSGEVLAVRTAGFGNPNVPDQTFARVLLDQGGVTAVNLGPRHELQNMPPADLKGKHISFLAHPAKIGDRVALVAEELRVEGRTIHVDWSAAAPRS